MEDTGTGIAPELLGRIFDPFQQDTGNPRIGGTGLGLAIANRQIGLMGGHLGVRSEPGRGSTFTATVTLPASSSQTAPPLAIDPAAGPPPC